MRVLKKEFHHDLPYEPFAVSFINGIDKRVIMRAFQCQQCGKCCYGEGGIRLKRNEIERISEFLGISREAFVVNFCEKRHEIDYIKTGPDNYCIFFNREKQCMIHPAKPDICTLWPFYPAILSDPDNWKMAQEACPGINPDCTFEEFVLESGQAEYFPKDVEAPTL
jgi:hypothetical protein